MKNQPPGGCHFSTQLVSSGFDEEQHLTGRPAAPTFHRVKTEHTNTHTPRFMPYLCSGLIASDPHNELFINPPASRAAAITAANDAVIKAATTQDVTREVSAVRGHRREEGQLRTKPSKQGDSNLKMVNEKCA